MGKQGDRLPVSPPSGMATLYSSVSLVDTVEDDRAQLSHQNSASKGLAWGEGSPATAAVECVPVAWAESLWKELVQS